MSLEGDGEALEKPCFITSFHPRACCKPLGG